MFFIPQFSKDYIEGFGATATELNQNHIWNPQSKFFRNAINLAAYGAYDVNVTEDDDYVGTWEDSFLFTGYENGKYGFLTSCVANIIGRHDFEVYTTNHFPQYRQPSVGANEIVVGLNWKGQGCIPNTDYNGNTVRVGITDPRLYLPKVVQNLLDLEFGYDKELFGKETVEKQIMT